MIKCAKCDISADETYIMDWNDVKDWPDEYKNLCEKCYDEYYDL